MTATSRVSISGRLALFAALVLIAASVSVTYLVLRPPSPVVGSPSERAVERRLPDPSLAGESPAQASRPIVVPVSREAAERAGILVETVGTTTGAATLRVPAVIEPNAYRSVAVTAQVSGRVTRVAGELGQRVRRGVTLAEIYSPELAEAHTRYTSAVARLRAHDQELQRTLQLVRIGAASQQELDGVHAEHAAQTAEVQSARSRLTLLGVPGAALERGSEDRPPETTSHVPAPIGGVVTERAANVGLNVDPAMVLFRVVDLSHVWVVASVYEKDFGMLRLGAPAVVRVPAYPKLSIDGRISYIDPQVNPETRTARVRVEVPNTAGEQLRLGMYVDVELADGAPAVVTVVPREAVQTIAQRTVVYKVNPANAGEFIEQTVTVGRADGTSIEVLEGLSAGDVIATKGSFFIRAERERLGLGPGGPAPNASPVHAAVPASAVSAGGSVQDVAVRVTERGFEPATIRVGRGQAMRLTFTRTTDATCAKEVVVPTLKLRRPLPLDTPVTVELTTQNQDIAFACGMDMLRGTLLVQ
jgi:RND family efflux transporter MFP subunit